MERGRNQMHDLILAAQKALDNDDMKEYEKIQEKVRKMYSEENNS